jgi:hypothetical protein
MRTVELIHYSLGVAFENLEHVVKDLTQEQADWLPPGKANSIGALYWHTIGYCDQAVHEWSSLSSGTLTFTAARSRRSKVARASRAILGNGLERTAESGLQGVGRTRFALH